MTRVAFLGLGHMGLPMARNLAAAGHDVVGFDVFPGARDAARAAGLAVAESGPDAVTSLGSSQGAEIVITMFQSGRQVIDAYAGVEGADGLVAVASPHTLFIDCSTIAVDEAREVHRLAEVAGHRALDAPVSGGVVGAENGTLA
ncbi:MAG: NAD(P)-binding domain-containing protein, partial [Microbacterium sp.]